MRAEGQIKYRMTTATSADDVISILGLIRHPEGGYYCEIYRDAAADGSRGLVSSIYYPLRAGDPDRWHRHDAQEIWCHHAGSPVEVSNCQSGSRADQSRSTDSQVT